jgi:NlpC/P60 family
MKGAILIKMKHHGEHHLMKKICWKPEILGLFLSVFFSTAPVFAVASPAVIQNSEPPTTQTFLRQLETQELTTSMDCSHFVHALYGRAGLRYEYANSFTLYRGTAAFQRVPLPESGDLVVWRGHTGIVVDPSTHSFVSSLRTGVKISSYISNYWKRLGPPRFLRFATSFEKEKGSHKADQSTPNSIISATSSRK